MTTARAVTDEASAASHETLEIAERHAEFLPTDKEYMRTGILPDAAEKPEKPATEKPAKPAAAADEDEAGAAAGEDDSAAGGDAAGSQPATAQDRKRANENRWAKLSRVNRELELENARLKGKTEGAATRETNHQETQPATAATVTPTKPVEPKIDDVDPKTNKPKYATYTDYLAAVRQFDRDAILAEIKGDQTKTEQQRQAEAAERTIEAEVNNRVVKIREAHADYDDAIGDVMAKKDAQGREELFYTKGSHIDGFFLDSEVGHEVMYHLAKNWDAHKAIFARDDKGKYLMNPVRQLRELAKIENRLDAGSSNDDDAGEKPGAGAGSSSAKPVTQAPRPAHQVSGKGTVQKDAIAQAVLDGDSDTYIREQNARDLARRNKRA